MRESRVTRADEHGVATSSAVGARSERARLYVSGAGKVCEADLTDVLGLQDLSTGGSGSNDAVGGPMVVVGAEQADPIALGNLEGTRGRYRNVTVRRPLTIVSSEWHQGNGSGHERHRGRLITN